MEIEGRVKVNGLTQFAILLQDAVFLFLHYKNKK